MSKDNDKPAMNNRAMNNELDKISRSENSEIGESKPNANIYVWANLNQQNKDAIIIKAKDYLFQKKSDEDEKLADLAENALYKTIFETLNLPPVSTDHSLKNMHTNIFYHLADLTYEEEDDNKNYKGPDMNLMFSKDDISKWKEKYYDILIIRTQALEAARKSLLEAAKTDPDSPNNKCNSQMTFPIAQIKKLDGDVLLLWKPIVPAQKIRLETLAEPLLDNASPNEEKQRELLEAIRSICPHLEEASVLQVASAALFRAAQNARGYSRSQD